MRRPVGACLVLALWVWAAPSRAQSFSAPVALGPDASWTNYLRVTDLDGDGDLDVVTPNCGGFFASPPGAQPLLAYRNDGGTFTDVSAAWFGGISKAVRQVAVGDIDGDGDLDVYVPDAGGGAELLFVNQGGGTFAEEGAARLPGVAPRAGAARFGDVDGDLDLDLVVADGYAQGGAATAIAHLYVNDGQGTFADASAGLPQTAGGTDPDDVDFIDFDRDFDLDLLINVHSGKSALWENDGAGVFTDVSAKLPAMPGGFHYGPAVCDVDGDGDLDIWTDNMGPGYTEQLAINDGAGSFSDETSARVTDNPGADDNGVVCADVDQDGDFDAVIPSLQSAAERVLLNDGSGHFTLEPGVFPAASDPTLWLELGDLDGDARLDAVTGQGEGNPQTNLVYLDGPDAVVDARPPRILAVSALGVVAAADEPILSFAVSDGTVSDEGPRLARAFVTRAGDDGPAEVEAVFAGGDVFRARMPSADAGTELTLTACATDLAGNTGCAAPLTYQVEGGTGGAGGGAGGAGAGAAGGAGGGDGGGGTSGSAGDDDDGCGCRAAGAPASGGGFGWTGWLVALWWLTRRARHSTTSDVSPSRSVG